MWLLEPLNNQAESRRSSGKVLEICFWKRVQTLCFQQFWVVHWSIWCRTEGELLRYYNQNLKWYFVFPWEWSTELVHHCCHTGNLVLSSHNRWLGVMFDFLFRYSEWLILPRRRDVLSFIACSLKKLFNSPNQRNQVNHCWVCFFHSQPSEQRNLILNTKDLLFETITNHRLFPQFDFDKFWRTVFKHKTQ